MGKIKGCLSVIGAFAVVIVVLGYIGVEMAKNDPAVQASLGSQQGAYPTSGGTRTPSPSVPPLELKS